MDMIDMKDFVEELERKKIDGLVSGLEQAEEAVKDALRIFNRQLIAVDELFKKDSNRYQVLQTKVDGFRKFNNRLQDALRSRS